MVRPEACTILWNCVVAPQESHTLIVGKGESLGERQEAAASRRQKLDAEEWANMDAWIKAGTIKSQHRVTEKKRANMGSPRASPAHQTNFLFRLLSL